MAPTYLPWNGTWLLQEAHCGPQSTLSNAYTAGNAIPSSIACAAITGISGDKLSIGDVVSIGFGPGISENVTLAFAQNLGDTQIRPVTGGNWLHNHSSGEAFRAISTSQSTGFKDPVAASPGLDNSAVNNALATPFLAGFCLRVGLVDLYNDSQVFCSDVLDYAKAKATANRLNFAFRVMGGRYTPPFVFDTLLAPNYVDSRVTPLRSPLPFNPDGTQETAFGPWYTTAIANDLAPWARANGAVLLHGSWYACQFAEVNFDDELSQQPGYSYNVTLSAHNAITDALAAEMGPGLAVELPLSGNGCTVSGQVTQITVTAGGSGYSTGATAAFSSGAATASVQVTGGIVTGLTITNAGSGYNPKIPPTITISPVGAGSGAAAFAGIGQTIGGIDNDLGSRMVSASGASHSRFFTQVNGVTDVSNLIMGTNVGHGLQMNSVLNTYSWDDVWGGEVYPNNAAYLEVYTQSFAGGTAPRLKENIKRWALEIQQQLIPRTTHAHW